MDSSKMIQTIDDALFTIDMGETDEDVLNEVWYPPFENG